MEKLKNNMCVFGLYTETPGLLSNFEGGGAKNKLKKK